MKKNLTLVCALLLAVCLKAQTILSISGASTGTVTMPTSGGPFFIRITARGGDGGLGRGYMGDFYKGGQGTIMSGIFTVQNGETILFISGSKGDGNQGIASGGGGGAGSGAVNSTTGTILLIAAGGNGGSIGEDGSHGLITLGNGNGGATVGNDGAGGGGGLNGPGEDSFDGGFGGAQVSLTGISQGGLAGTEHDGAGGSGMGGGGGAANGSGGGGGGQSGGGPFGGAGSLPGGVCQNNIPNSATSSPEDGYVQAELLEVQTFYKDKDGDGYGDASINTPGPAACAPEGYVANSSDCDDNNPAVNPSTVWVLDRDNDGYYTGDPVAQCTSPGTGYTIKTTQQPGDCNDNDVAIQAPRTYYLDYDKDGYGNPAKTVSVCSSTPPDGYVSNNKDCNDNDAAISPVAVEVCGNKVDDNCDGAVDEKSCYACQNATNLNTSNITSGSAQLNWSATANPQQWQLEYKTISQGTKWIDVYLTGNIRSAKITGLSAKQNYNWHVRAKCNGKWTDYTSIVSFKTGASSIAGSSKQQSISAGQSNEENPGVQLYPNPTRGQFAIELHLADNINANAKIELLNMRGKTVSTDNAIIANGTLFKNISISSSLAPGIYIARVTVNDKTYTTKLIYEK